MLTSKRNNIEVQRNAIAFFDDCDFCVGGIELKIKMQEIVDCYATMCETTGVKVQTHTKL